MWSLQYCACSNDATVLGDGDKSSSQLWATHRSTNRPRCAQCRRAQPPVLLFVLVWPPRYRRFFCRNVAECLEHPLVSSRGPACAGVDGQSDSRTPNQEAANRIHHPQITYVTPATHHDGKRRVLLAVECVFQPPHPLPRQMAGLPTCCIHLSLRKPRKYFCGVRSSFQIVGCLILVEAWSIRDYIR